VDLSATPALRHRAIKQRAVVGGLAARLTSAVSTCYCAGIARDGHAARTRDSNNHNVVRRFASVWRAVEKTMARRGIAAA